MGRWAKGRFSGSYGKDKMKKGNLFEARIKKGEHSKDFHGIEHEGKSMGIFRAKLVNTDCITTTEDRRFVTKNFHIIKRQDYSK